MGFIYRLLFPNNKSYVGQTTRTVKERVKEHKSPSCKCLLVKKAIGKYPDFIVETLLEINNELLDEYEIKFIEMYDTVSPNGYNLTSGGEGCPGYKHTEETRLKMKEAKLLNSTVISEETRDKMRETFQSTEYREKCSKSHRKHNLDQEIPRFIHRVDKTRPNGSNYTGYVVRIPGRPEKNFVSMKLTEQEKLTAAINYIKEQEY